MDFYVHLLRCIMIFFGILVFLPIATTIYYCLKYYVFRRKINKYQCDNNCKLLIIADSATNNISSCIRTYLLHDILLDIDDDSSFVNQMESIFENNNLHIILHTYGGSILTK